MFASFQAALEKYFLQSLVPDGIAKPVLAALTQFAAKATRLGTVGLVVLVVTALALMLTIDRTLNAIWRVRRPRPIAQRVLVYWAALTLGPLLLGISLSLTSAVLGGAQLAVGALPGSVGVLLAALEFVLLAAGVAALYHYVPNTDVRWRHAVAGGLFVAVGLELAKRGLAWYVGLMPTYSMVYGAFATLPIFLLWIYLGWVIVLLGRGDRRLCAESVDAGGTPSGHAGASFYAGAGGGRRTRACQARAATRPVADRVGGCARHRSAAGRARRRGVAGTGLGRALGRRGRPAAGPAGRPGPHTGPHLDRRDAARTKCRRAHFP